MDLIFATEQRMTRGNIILQPRGVSAGGNIVFAGHFDKWNCYLDFLNDKGLLNATQYSDGMAFKELHDRTHPSKTISLESRGEGMRQGVNEGEIGGTHDQILTKWILVNRYIPARDKKIINVVCLTDAVQADKTTEKALVENFNANRRRINLAFDQLPHAMKRADDEVFS